MPEEPETLAGWNKVYPEDAGEERSAPQTSSTGARELFTDSDKYIVRIQPHASEPLRSLALAASLAIDVIMKQKDY